MMTLLLTTLALAPLRCELSVQAESRVNEPLPLVMTLTNQGEGPLEVLSWFTPFEGWFADAIDLTLADRPVAYRGPLAKRGNPGADDFFILGAGQQSRADAELTQVYDLSRPGVYHLSYRAQPLTLTQGVAPRCPAISFSRIAAP
ncbi:protease [Aeromonas sp. MR16]|uniref:protease n=1 Tax=Aeromonas sp. MR16 TaxID=2923420 RepID=UPI001F4A2508|nr:protease [Aeromonas sp. MR16]MCH7373131.1 protease [Aeromonas sp. MR16]